MTTNGVLQIMIYFVVLLLTVKPMGLYMTRVFNGEKTWLDPIMRPMERLLYRIWKVSPEEDMKWTTYTYALLIFSLIGIVVTYALLRLQEYIPFSHIFNPQHFGAAQMPPDLAFNTASSFATNTNWQSYVPESSVSYFSNMVSLAVHNWMSAATGVAVALALTRGLARRSAAGIGNFWVDITRASLYVLFPICLVYALCLVQQGVPQNFAPYTQATTLEGATQSIGQGPVASQEAIKMLGTNGGGFFNANSAHPFENPTPLSNFIEMLSIFLIPAGLMYMFGKMVGNVKQGWALFGAVSALFLLGAFICYGAEQSGNPNITTLGIHGGNMEGKEARFGIAASALFATITTDASCGAVNAMHDSFTPIGGLVPLVNILTGEVIFGGVGAGLYGLLMFAVLSVFIAGLMVGRTPEYLGKKIEQYEVKMAMVAVLILAASVLGFAALASNLNIPAHSAWNHVNGSSPSVYEGAAYNNVNNSGPHGLSEIVYTFASATGNNGSAFAGITANTPFYNLTIGFAMLIGRFLMLIPLLAIAGSLAAKKFSPASAGTFPTDTATFSMLLASVIIIVGALTYFPALALGPVVEHYHMLSGKLF